MIKGKKLQPRILYPGRLSFRFDGEIKRFTDKQKLFKEFKHHKTSFIRNVKRPSLSEKEKARRRKMRVTKGKSSLLKSVN